MRLLFLERDIDKALRRMALEEEKNLTETVNDILWKGLKDYLKQTGTNERAHFYTLLSGVCASCGASLPVGRRKLPDRECFVTSFRQGGYTLVRR